MFLVKTNNHVFTGQISKVSIPVIAVLGTDCACGKRTTAVELNKALNNSGLKSVLVATGQTGLMQGAKYGVSLDALISQFAIGELENAVVQAFENENWGCYGALLPGSPFCIYASYPSVTDATSSK